MRNGISHRFVSESHLTGGTDPETETETETVTETVTETETETYTETETHIVPYDTNLFRGVQSDSRYTQRQ